METARRKIAETEAALVVARTDILAGRGKIQEARSAYQQAVDELETKQEIYRRNPAPSPSATSRSSRSPSRGARARSTPPPPQRRAAEARISSLLPAEKASAEAALAQAEVDLTKTVVRAGVTGGWSSSRCGWATSSTRSCVRPES